MQKILLLIYLAVFLIHDSHGQDCNGFRKEYQFPLGNYWYNTDPSSHRIGLRSSSAIRKNENNIPIIFAFSPWVVGVNDKGTLYGAGNTYTSQFDNFDFYPGPLNDEGLTTPDQCTFWDQMFVVQREELIQARNILYDENGSLNTSIDCDLLPQSILRWPAQGNENLAPFTPDHEMATFFDYNLDGVYNPCDGDLPSLYHEDCAYLSIEEVVEAFPQTLVYRIMNDAGGPHRFSDGDPMHIEVHEFLWCPVNIKEEEEDFLFSRYRVVNRGPHNFEKFGFAYWADYDLGCAFDDYSGCIANRRLVFNYNEDPIDGNLGENCSGGYNTFKGNPPILGTAMLKGLDTLDDNGNTLDLGNTATLFTFNGGINPPPTNYPTDATNEEAMAALISGLNNYKQPIVLKGDTIKYMFDGIPADTSAFTMCHRGISNVDTRVIMASFGASLAPGAYQDIILGQFLTYKAELPCPELDPLFEVHDRVIDLYNNCYIQPEAIDAPKLSYQRTSNEINLKIDNDPLSNNFNESFKATIKNLPPETKENQYKFEGYKVYQVASPNIRLNQLENPNFSKLVYQTDVVNSISTIYNYESLYNGTVKTYRPKIKVDGANMGIDHEFSIDHDYLTNSPIQRNKEYYFIAVSYAYNNYQTFDTITGSGQAYPYVQSTQAYPLVVKISEDNEEFAPQITRIHGMGNANDLEITPSSYQAILNNTHNGRITYEINKGPFDVVVIDSTKLTGKGKFRVMIEGDFDDKHNTCAFDPENTMVSVLDLSDGMQYTSQTTLLEGDHIFEDLGFVVHIHDVPSPGGDALSTSGFISQRVAYADDSGEQWLLTITNANADSLNQIDSVELNPTFYNPSRDLFEIFSGPLQDIAFPLASCSYSFYDQTVISPGATSSIQLGQRASLLSLSKLNNVDIVFTNDKELWSRCIVVNSGIGAYNNIEEIGYNENMLTMKKSDSVDKNGRPDGSGYGMGWFPGYAIDVETGERLNIFFGENTALNNDFTSMKDKSICDDMIFNPSEEIFTNIADTTIHPFLKAIVGGQHFVYVTRQQYDECESLKQVLSKNTDDFAITNLFTWALTPILHEGSNLLSLDEGLIPNDVRISLRVNNPFSVELENTSNDLDRCKPIGDNPTYEFEILKNPSFKNNNGVSNRSVPWSVATNINYFRLFDLDEEVMVTINDQGGKSLNRWYVPEGEELIIDSKSLPQGKFIGFISVRSKVSEFAESNRIVIFN